MLLYTVKVKLIITGSSLGECWCGVYVCVPVRVCPHVFLCVRGNLYHWDFGPPFPTVPAIFVTCHSSGWRTETVRFPLLCHPPIAYPWAELLMKLIKEIRSRKQTGNIVLGSRIFRYNELWMCSVGWCGRHCLLGYRGYRFSYRETADDCLNEMNVSKTWLESNQSQKAEVWRI